MGNSLLKCEKCEEYKISYNRNNFKFYVSLTVNKKFRKEDKHRTEWCSIDPGEKTFATIYDTFNKNILFVANNERDSFSDCRTLLREYPTTRHCPG